MNLFHRLTSLLLLFLAAPATIAKAQETNADIETGNGVVYGELPATVFYQGEKTDYLSWQNFVRALPDGTILRYEAFGYAGVDVQRIDATGMLIWHKEYRLWRDEDTAPLKELAKKKNGPLLLLEEKYKLAEGHPLDGLGYYASRQHESGRYVLAEGFMPRNGRSDIVIADELMGIVRINGDGKILWHQRTVFDLNLQVIASMRVDNDDGGLWVGGISEGNATYPCGQPTILRLDRNGKEQWRWMGTGRLGIRAPTTLQPLSRGSVLAAISPSSGATIGSLPNAGAESICQFADQPTTDIVEISAKGELLDVDRVENSDINQSLRWKDGRVLMIGLHDTRIYDAEGELVSAGNPDLLKMINFSYHCYLRNMEAISDGTTAGLIMIIEPDMRNGEEKCQAWPPEYYLTRRQRVFYFAINKEGKVALPITVGFGDSISVDLSSDGKSLLGSGHILIGIYRFKSEKMVNAPMVRQAVLPQPPTNHGRLGDGSP